MQRMKAATIAVLLATIVGVNPVPATAQGRTRVDRYEDRWDKREDKRDRREDRWDRREDKRDRREDRWDRREDRYDARDGS